MIPTLLSFAKENKGYADDFGIFEIGHTVDGLRENGECDERNKLGVLLYSKTQSEESLFRRAANAARELVCDILHKGLEFASTEGDYDFCHPVNSFDLLVDGKKIGFIAVPHPTVCENIDKKCAVAFFEIFTESFADTTVGRQKYSEPSKFPAIEIDVTFAADPASLDFTSLTALAKSTAGAILSDMWVKDIYVGEDGYATTLRFAFLSRERTLTKQELGAVVETITAAFAEEQGIKVK
jgi:phenylalanyl-tRNA synthetase beta chain